MNWPFNKRKPSYQTQIECLKQRCLEIEKQVDLLQDRPHTAALQDVLVEVVKRIVDPNHEFAAPCRWATSVQVKRAPKPGIGTLGQNWSWGESSKPANPVDKHLAMLFGSTETYDE
jgi:hypothetical protein